MAERGRYPVRDPRFDLFRLTGLAANRPDPTLTDDGIVYFATDSGDVSFCLSGAWVQHSTNPMPFVAGSWHLGNDVGSISAAAMVASQAYALLVRFPDGASTLTGLGVQVTTGGAGSAVRLGVYGVGTNGLPGARLLDAGTVATTGTGAATITSLTLAITVKSAFLVAVEQGGTPPSVNMTDSVGPVAPQTSAADMLTGAYVPYASAVSGALPATFGAPAGYATAGPLIAMQLS